MLICQYAALDQLSKNQSSDYPRVPAMHFAVLRCTLKKLLNCVNHSIFNTDERPRDMPEYHDCSSRSFIDASYCVPSLATTDPGGAQKQGYNVVHLHMPLDKRPPPSLELSVANAEGDRAQQRGAQGAKFGAADIVQLAGRCACQRRNASDRRIAQQTSNCGLPTKNQATAASIWGYTDTQGCQVRTWDSDFARNDTNTLLSF